MSRNYQFTTKGVGVERMREGRKKKKAAASSSVNELVEALPPDHASQVRKGKRPGGDDDYDWAGNSICLTFPSDACAHTDPRPYRKQISKILWPEDRSVLEGLKFEAPASTVDHILIGLQGAIHMSERIVELEKSVKELRDERGGFKAEMKALTAAKDELERVNKELHAQLDEERRDSSLLKSTMARLKSLEATIVCLKEQLELVGCEGEILARVEMAREYADGKAGSWDLDTIFAAYDELMAKRAEDAAQVDDLAATLGGLNRFG